MTVARRWPVLLAALFIVVVLAVRLPAACSAPLSDLPLQAGSPLDPATFEISEPLHTFTLDNGLQVLVLRSGAAQVAAVQVWYRVGGRDERAGEHGLAHLFEHMMFRGTTTVGPEEFIRRIQAVGGRSNAWTSEDVTVYHETLPAQHLELALELEADRMANLALDAGMLDTERQVVLEELRLRLENDPLGAAYSWYKKLFFSVHPYRHDVLGDAEQLNSFTVEQCRNFYRQFYRPGNALLVISGDLDPSRVEQLVRHHFGPLPAVEAVDHPSPAPEPYGLELTRHTLKLPVEVPVVGLGFHTPEASHPDYAALEVIRELLTGGSRARLTNSLVREQRLAVYVDTIFERTIDPSGLVAFAVFLPSVRSKTVEKAMWDEIRLLSDEDVPEEELDQARRRLLVRRLFSLSGPEGAATALGWAAVVEGDVERFAARAARIEAVTAEDVRRVAQAYLTEKNVVVGWIKPDRFRIKYYLFGILKSLLGK